MSEDSLSQTPAPFEDTIIAISTPQGHGALGTIRVSGPETLNLLARHCFSRKKALFSAEFLQKNTRRALYCDVTDGQGEILDEGIVIFYPGPASYTGEDTCEITLHGNPILLRRFVTAALSMSGIRPADPGEFTRRAFLNDKMDLTQAEAVRRIIDAKSEFELNAGRKILGGELNRMINRFRSALISLKAETEAEVDFSTEDLTFESREERKVRVRELSSQITQILERGENTARLSSGFQIALVGVPNAGKSSLLNLMLGWDRSIVSAVPGTTRDYVSEEIHIDGVQLRIVDTAGLRNAEDAIEEEGVRRTRKEIERSQIILHVIDGAREKYELPEVSNPGNLVYVINKEDSLHKNSWLKDLPPESQPLLLSCKSGTGLKELKERLREIVYADFRGGDPLLLEDRHRFHFSRILDALQRVRELWENEAPDEITAIEIDRALEHAGEITGQISNDEVLGRIFSLFCVGK